MSLRANTQSTSTREYVESREYWAARMGNTDQLTAPRRYFQEAGTKSHQGDQGIRNKVNGTPTLYTHNPTMKRERHSSVEADNWK
jgi:hypothetical protein